MEKKTVRQVSGFLERLETQRGKISEKLYITVKEDYLKRLDESDPGRLPVNPALERLFGRLSGVMDEILLRVFTGEFSNDELLDGIQRLGMFNVINDLMSLFNGLESFKSSIHSIIAEEIPEDPPDLDDVLMDFDAIDIFADYEEGDETYDLQYEEEDRWVLNELFLHIMDGYIEPIVVGLKAAVGGRESTRLFQALLASLRPLVKSAETMGFSRMGTALGRLESLLHRAARKGAMSPILRIKIMKAYDELRSHLPDSESAGGLMDLANRDSGTSSFILHLISSEAIDEWMVQALLETGINSREKLEAAAVHEISAVTGLSLDRSRDLLKTCQKEIAV